LWRFLCKKQRPAHCRSVCTALFPAQFSPAPGLDVGRRHLREGWRPEPTAWGPIYRRSPPQTPEPHLALRGFDTLELIHLWKFPLPLFLFLTQRCKHLMGGNSLPLKKSCFP
jgi:hypothetical protein